MSAPEHRTAAQIADRISWRDPEFLVSVGLFALFAFTLVGAYCFSIPQGSEQAVGLLQGASIAGLTAMTNYWLGSSRGSRRSADRADKAVDAAKAIVEAKQ